MNKLIKLIILTFAISACEQNEIILNINNIKSSNLNINVLLEGSYSSNGEMSNGLQGLIPLNEPYTGLGYNLTSSEGSLTTQEILDAPDDKRVMDWIIVELRDANDPSIILSSQSALLLANGSIVKSNGSLISINRDNINSAFIAIHHRNHLGVMSKNPILFNQNEISIDLTDINNVYTDDNITTSPLKDMGDGFYALYNGDVDNDGEISTAIDAMLVFTNSNPSSINVYSIYDISMDNGLNVFDPIFAQINGTPSTLEHIP